MTVLLAAQGLAVAPPRGWDVRIYRRPPQGPEATYAVLHAGTFALPSSRGDYGDGAVQLMGPGDAFVALVEFDPASAGQALFAGRGFPAPPVADDFSRTSLQVSIAGHGGAQQWFTEADRPWCLYVVIGDWANRGRLAALAGRLVTAIEVQAR